MNEFAYSTIFYKENKKYKKIYNILPNEIQEQFSNINNYDNVFVNKVIELDLINFKKLYLINDDLFKEVESDLKKLLYEIYFKILIISDFISGIHFF
jgi:hypothetical protein